VTTADSRQGGPDSALVRSDVVFFETGAGGAVFSVGSIAWCGALRAAGTETPVGRMTWNVLARFVAEAPFTPPRPPGSSNRSPDLHMLKPAGTVPDCGEVL
jgi:hypothetical protein